MSSRSNGGTVSKVAADMTTDADLERFFSYLDKDNDGQVTVKDVKKAIKRNALDMSSSMGLSKYSDEGRLDATLRSVDSSNKGSVSFTEFKTYIRLLQQPS